jgi:hypothetical protein
LYLWVQFETQLLISAKLILVQNVSRCFKKELPDSLWHRQSQQSFNTLTLFNLFFTHYMFWTLWAILRWDIQLVIWRTILIQLKGKKKSAVTSLNSSIKLLLQGQMLQQNFIYNRTFMYCIYFIKFSFEYMLSCCSQYSRQQEQVLTQEPAYYFCKVNCLPAVKLL